MPHVPDQHTPRRATTRLAPSPTGALHLGNARTFMVNWALARNSGWRIVLRIEDLDTPRNKPGAAEQAIADLRWLGIDWDEGPHIQSADLSPHRAAMDRLARAGLAYPCELSRSQIDAAASAPQEVAPTDGAPVDAALAPGGESRFPSSLRPVIVPGPFDRAETNWRFVTPPRDVAFTDAFKGPQRLRPEASVGDFVIWTARGHPAYQLAVVVDDARQGVTHVVRGDDLLDSAARQILLYEALSLGPPPAYCHLPLVRGADGRRLAKRHGDTRLSRYRDARVASERLVGLLAFWCGVQPRRAPLSPEEFRAGLELGRIPPVDAIFGPEDDAWLLQR